MDKVWCKHIVWEDLSDRCASHYLWWFVSDDCASIVTKNWKVCPICQAPRPTRANKRAAANRFAQDNEQ
jgi:hypothetical protein